MKLDITSETQELTLFKDPKDSTKTRCAWVPTCRTYGDLHPDQEQEWRSSNDLLARALDPDDTEYTVKVRISIEKRLLPTQSEQQKDREYLETVRKITELPCEFLQQRTDSTEV